MTQVDRQPVAMTNWLRSSKPLVNEHDRNIAKYWKRWKQQCEYFEAATELTFKEEKIQIAAFILIMCSAAIEIYNSLISRPPTKSLFES